MNRLACAGLILLFFLTNVSAQAQMDSLILKNNNQLNGSIKSMDKGVLSLGTDFTKQDIQIKWNTVSQVYSEKQFLIFTTSGKRYFGRLTTRSPNQIVIQEDGGGEIPVTLDDITLLQRIRNNFLNRFSGGIDVGFTQTQASNQSQLTLRSNIVYTSESWYGEVNTSHFSNNQSEAERIARGDGNLSMIYLFKDDWFAIAKVDYLYNTQQLLDFRSNFKLGGGRFLAKNNHFFWNLLGGAALNEENYATLSRRRQSWEGWVGSQLYLFNVGRLSLQNNVSVYPGITEKGRIRIDHHLDLTYGFSLNFYARTSLTLNYDNQPVEGGTALDYIWQTTFGWMFGR